MKHTFIFIFFLILLPELYASKPMIAIAGVGSNSPRTTGLSVMIQNHLINIIDLTGIFDIVDTNLLNKELKRFNCLEEKCILRFARKSKIGLVIIGELDDKGDYLILKLNAYGMDIPYYGKLIYKYVVEIPMHKNFTSTEYSYICEEHAGVFISKILYRYLMPVYINIKNNIIKFNISGKINGVYDIYRHKKGQEQILFKIYKKIGTVNILNSNLNLNQDSIEINTNDFIFVTYRDKASFLDNFYYGRKKEIVLGESLLTHTLYIALFTVPVSASMPVVAPLFGYYRNNDWEGLSLWALNSFPYLYFETKGLIKNPRRYRDEKRNIISREIITQNRFAIYMLFMGGTALFVDAVSHQYLNNARNFQGIQSLMGNSFSAGYLALVSGGAGHFYRGHRPWGYLYFHLNNILLYLTIREFSPEERYDIGSDSYQKEDINKKAAFALVGTYTAVKIVEVIHAVLMRDRIRNGKVIDEKLFIEPVVYLDRANGINFGAQYCYRF